MTDKTQASGFSRQEKVPEKSKKTLMIMMRMMINNNELIKA